MRPLSPDPRQAPRGWERFAKPRAPEDLPVRLHRKRLYIMPSGFGVGLALFLIATVMSAINNSNNHALLFAVGAGAMLGVALIQTHHRLANIRVLSIHAFPAHEGEEIVIRTTLDHRGKRVREGLRLAIGSQEVAFDLQPGEPHSVDLRLPGLPRGIHPMARIRVSTARPMNIALAWSWIWPKNHFLIYPKLETPAPPAPSRGMEAESTRAARQGEQVHHLRDWRVGDAMRDIAWKATARQGKLMSREYEAREGGMQQLDWEEVSHLPTEQALSRLATWVVAADERGLRTDLTLPGVHVGSGQGLSHRHACLTALAQVKADVAV